jgi:hypothetical protein
MGIKSERTPAKKTAGVLSLRQTEFITDGDIPWEEIIFPA